MRKTWRATVVADTILAVVAAFLPAAVRAQPQVTARAAIIVDAETGGVVWEYNADEPLPPASTTKVMTAVLALQSHRLDEQFAVSANAAATPPSKIGLRIGQSVALRDLLYAVLLKSANDASVVVAEGVAGSEYEFADRMNLKARVVGATTTNFVNPHGLTEYGHVTTARDLSRIFRYGLGVPGFREVLLTTSAQVPIEGPHARLTTVRSHNRLLNAPDYQVIGKTGYTRLARRCFVGAAGHGPREVVIAILGSSDLWGDARRMLYFAFSADRPTPVLMASATPPPRPAPELRAAPPVAVVRAAPPPPAESVPSPAAPPSEPERPVQMVRADMLAAPQAALERAARMARAQTVEPPVESEPAPAADDIGAPSEVDDDREPVPAGREAADVEGDPEPAEPAAMDEQEPAPRVWADSPLRDSAEAPRPRVPRAEPSVETDQPERVVEDEPERDLAEPSRARTAPSRVRRRATGVASARPDETRREARADSRRAARDRNARSRSQTVAERRKPSSVAVGSLARSSRRAAEPSREHRAGPRATKPARERRSGRRNAPEEGDDRAQAVALTRRSSAKTKPARSTVGESESAPKAQRKGRGAEKAADTAAAAGKYTVQVGPYRDPKAAASARADLKKRGYASRVVGRKLELGNFAEKARADKVATRLRVNGHRATSAAAR